MSDLATTYALQVGVPLHTPEISDAFFPLDWPIEKSVLIHGFGGAIVNGNQATFPAKVYDYFGEVVSIIKPVLEKNGYKLFQIGAPGEPAIKGLEQLVGRTSIPQCAFLVKRCALLVCNDSLWSHLRGAYGGSLVTVFGPTSTPHFPHWKNDEKTVIIESHRFGKKPSFQSNENPKTINLIAPETVANAVFALNGFEKVKRESILMGQIYNMPVVELVPDVVIDPRVQISTVPIIRMDLHFNEENLAKNLSFKKCSIITNKEIDINILARFRGNIESIRIEIDGISPEWIRKVKRLGIKNAIMALEKDEEKIVKMRLDFYDVLQPMGFDRFLPPTVDDFKKESEKYMNKPLDKDIKLDSLFFKTNKFILSNGKVFLSKAHWRAGIAAQSTDDNTGKVIDTPDFWEEFAHFYIYK